MNPNYILLLYCALIAFFCSFFKQLYETKYYPRNKYVFLIDVLLSTLSGIVFSMILTEYIKNDLSIIGLSGLGGMFGESILKALMKLKLGKRIRIHISFEEDEDIVVKHNTYDCVQHPTKKDHYNCIKEKKTE